MDVGQSRFIVIHRHISLIKWQRPLRFRLYCIAVMVWLLFKRSVWWKYHPIKELMCFALIAKTLNPQYYIRPSLPSSIVCEFAANVQRSWRRWESWRGERGPLLPFPVHSTWSWANCCSTSEAHFKKGSFSWVLCGDLCVSAVRLTTSPKLMRSARWLKTSGTRGSPNCACLPTDSSVRWKLTPGWGAHLFQCNPGTGCSFHLFLILDYNNYNIYIYIL